MGTTTTTQKTHWKKLHNPDYLGAYSLDVDGKYIEKNVIIEKVINDVVIGADSKKDTCIVAKLAGEKPMILNSTNCKTLKKLFNSPHVEDWTGKPITIYVAKVRAFGEEHDALRIRPTFPNVGKPVLNSAHPRWEGAIKALTAGNTTIEAIKKQYELSADDELTLKRLAGI